MSKNILIHLGVHDINPIDSAIDYIKEGSKVFFIACDQSVSPCIYNKCGNSVQCRMCKQMQKTIIKKYIKTSYELHYISEFITPNIQKEADNYCFNYNNTKELKDIIFHGVEIGYGAFSTYVTLTRHCNPLYNDSVKSYINHLLRNQIITTLVTESIINVFKPDLIILHNGRFAQYKPFLNLAQNKKIEYITTEVLFKADGIERKNNFYMDIPHSISSSNLRIKYDWERANPETREIIGKSFYQNRRHAIAAGDRVFIKDQKEGMLPDNWDDTKHNIVIFNSSEDEYVSISKEFDNNRLFKSQYDALICIFEHYKEDKNKHFYVRIHPNLGNVDDISHISLYTLNYTNVTIIPPKSPISTYALIDNADKIMVFNSTTGAEASYWGKPVISMDLCQYTDLNVVYSPKTTEELFSLINNCELMCKSNDNIIKYGYFLMRENYEPNNYIRHRWKSFKILGHRFIYSNTLSYLGSSKLYSVMSDISRNLLPKFGILSKFRKVPNDRDLWNLDIKD